MSVQLSGKQAAAILLFTLFVGAFGGGALVSGYEWGLYSNLMSRATDASLRGDGFAIMDATREDGMPLIVNEIALVRMVDLKLLETQELEQACREYETAPSQDLIPESEYRGPKDSPWVAAIFTQ